MQVESSSFQRIKHLIILLLLSLSLTQCEADSVWGVPLTRFRQRLERNEVEFLRDLEIDLEIDSAAVSEAFRLGPGAPFYLSHVFRDLGLEEAARRMLELQHSRGESPWREEAALLLVELKLESGAYEEAEALSRQSAREAEGRRQAAPLKRGLVEALYWQGKDEQVLELLERREESGLIWDDELDLFRAVSSYRLDRSGWQERFAELFFSRRTSSLHVRAYRFLEQEQVLQSFSKPVSAYFQAKDLLYRGQNSEALALLEASLSEIQSPRFLDPLVVEELGAAYFAAAAHLRGADYLLELAGRLSGPSRLSALEMAGRLYRKEGVLPEAERLLAAVIRETASDRQRDRAIWFTLDTARSRSHRDFLDQLGKLAPLSSDPQYFAGLLGEEISRLAAQRRWQDLLDLHRAMRGWGPKDTLARTAYLLGRSASLGLLFPPEEINPASLYLEARNNGGEGYYGLVAGAVLENMGIPAQWSPAAGAPTDPAPGNIDSEAESLIRGFLQFGRYELAYQRIQEDSHLLSPALLLEAAAVLQARGRVLASLRLMDQYVSRSGGSTGREKGTLLFPRAFRKPIEELAVEGEIPRALLFALVREESYFDPQIVSRSGAVGLTQLMPDTAADTARRLRLEQYDLRNPEDNLRLGAAHLSRLLLRLEDIPKSLMAYNAGLTRLRGWEQSFSGLPVDLLVEAVPYPETRNYVRKILVSAVQYGLLYYDQPAEQTVYLFFPSLKQSNEGSP